MLVGMTMVGFSGFKHFMAMQKSEKLVINKIKHQKNVSTVSGSKNVNDFPYHPSQVPQN